MEKIKILTREGKQEQGQRIKLAELDEKKPRKPRIPRLQYTDVTPEALMYSLAHDWPSGGIVTSEGGSVLGSHAMSADSAMRNFSLLNQLWDAETIPVARRMDNVNFTVQGARLTIALQVQEATLQSFFTSTKGLARGTGFLARFLIASPQSTQGTRKFREAPANWPALTAFNSRLTEVLNRNVPITKDGILEPVTLTLSPAAKVVWVGLHNKVEAELHSSGEFSNVRDVASKTADNAARIAALFHVFEGNTTDTIDTPEMKSAADIALWHLFEAC